MTPVQIEVLLHAYYSPLEHPRNNTMAIRDAIEYLANEDLILRTQSEPTNIFTTTDRGAAHVRQLCKTPLPISGWVNAGGEGL